MSFCFLVPGSAFLTVGVVLEAFFCLSQIKITSSDLALEGRVAKLLIDLLDVHLKNAINTASPITGEILRTRASRIRFLQSNRKDFCVQGCRRDANIFITDTAKLDVAPLSGRVYRVKEE